LCRLEEQLAAMSKKLDLLVEAHTDKASQKAGSGGVETNWRLQDSIFRSWLREKKGTPAGTDILL